MTGFRTQPIAPAGDAGLGRRSLLGRLATELGRVHSGAERGTGTGQDDRADLAVPAEGAEGLGELDPEVDRESVALLRSLQGDDRDVSSALQ